jgi:hypothetical protein
MAMPERAEHGFASSLLPRAVALPIPSGEVRAPFEQQHVREKIVGPCLFLTMFVTEEFHACYLVGNPRVNREEGAHLQLKTVRHVVVRM